MYHHWLIILPLFLSFTSAKDDSLNLNNYSEFLNFGKKPLKSGDNSLENQIIKSKVEVLGKIFKKNVDHFKAFQKLEIIFLIDASSSVGETNFKSELQFVKKLLSDVTVDYDHARVAIVTYSSAVVVNVDEISEPRKENNKCFLLNKLLHEIKYAGGGTYTRNAFQIAQKIFQKSRTDSKKVLFLITDGFSNGGDPIPIAKELKKDQVTVFTIGIQNGNYQELFELASAPGELYSYLLNSFQEFESLARRALHVDLKSGDYIPLGINSPCSSLCVSGDCCDKNALCTCGTTTGHYSCICQPGYYGSGFQNSCSPCPPATYSDGPNLCVPCPDIYHTTKPPAYSVKSCICKKGYQTTKDNQCKASKCSKISTPSHGYLVKKHECGNVPNTACGIRCEVGYTLVGSSIRLCQDNGTWSGEKPSCQVRTCNKLSPPLYGSISCSHLDLGLTYNSSEKYYPVDTICKFECKEGKTLIGSDQRTCLPLARWDGLKTSCKQIKCSKLPQIQNGRIEPESCMLDRQSLGTICKIICNPGFELEGPDLKKCTNNRGLWDSKFESSFCKDVTPPVITCPPNITANTKPGKKFGNVAWTTPDVVDNSGSDLSVWMKPSIKKITGFKFQIGNTKVTYFAQDGHHNKANCSFLVTIRDLEPPTIDGCENPLTFYTTEANGTTITWDEPTFFDNSNIVKFNKSHEFGFFPMGTTTVTYNVVDSSNNENSCSINITIESLKSYCESLMSPIYGVNNCSLFSDSVQCVITCEEGYAIPLSQTVDVLDSSTSFICNDFESELYNQNELMVPECSVTSLPKEIEQNGSVNISYPLDNCNNSKKLDEIENDVKIIVKETTCSENCNIITSTTCLDDNLQKENSEETSNIIKRDLNFEEVPHRNISRKRNKKKLVNVKFQVKGIYTNETTKEGFFQTQNLTIHFKKAKFICPIGFVPRKNRCVQCPKGTFYNATKTRCQSCPLGFYNDALGKSQCKQCPPNHSTRKLHSKKRQDCKEQCRPGTHAKTKILKPSKRNPDGAVQRATLRPYCRVCGLGYYQPSYGQLRCLPCQVGYTTTILKATSEDQCLPIEDICAENSNICNSGKCVNINDNQYTCICPENYIGSHCERKPSICDSTPCLNNGVCEETATGFKCKCQNGFSGTLCEETKEKCLLICINNGTCHTTGPNDYFCLCPAGFGGDSCEIQLNYCAKNLCENNGSCIEGTSSFYCKCSKGFIGRRCNLLPCDYKPCNGNAICVNLNVDNATKNSYKCVCPEGLTGPLCTEEIEHCLSSSCYNGGTCVNTISNYTCLCPELYHGSNCQLKRKINYVLHFPKSSTTDFVKLKGFDRNVTQISACLWMQSKDNFNYGTVISYATKKFDNAFTITDYTGLVVYVNNQHVVSDVLLNDGLWHHLCVSWKSENGSYKLYVDGNLLKMGNGLAANTQIEDGGNMILGQEQDILGGHFSQSETFIGRMAHVDVWSRELSEKEVTEHMNDCYESIFGNIYAWPKIQDYVEGSVLIENSSFCHQCKYPGPLFNGIINIVNNTAYYECYKGYYLSSLSFKEGRRCTKAVKWEGLDEPYCKKIYCGHPGYIRNGYPIGSKYYYSDKIAYQCYKNYNISGNTTIMCTETGSWYPEKPQCLGIQCKSPYGDNITILSEHNYEDFNVNQSFFDVGTQLQIVCNKENNVKEEIILNCQSNGTWDVDSDKCKESKTKTLKQSCDSTKIPLPPNNGDVVPQTLEAYSNGTRNSVEFQCRMGFRIMGENSTTCIVDGYWTEPNISCDPVLCPTPKYKNMTIPEERKDGYRFGDLIKLKCIDGYRMLGDGAVRCSSKGRWSRMKGKCSRKSCWKPMVDEDTTIEGNSYLYGDKVTLTCPSDNEYIWTCNSDGKWVGEKDDSC